MSAVRRERLPRAAILRNQSVWSAAFARAVRKSNAFFSLLTPNLEAEAVAQAAFLTPKRLGSAVVRNRLRRRMREAYRRHLTPVTGAHHEIWLAKSAATRLSFAEVTAAMRSLRGTAA